jgi:hypothetical protein
MRIRLADSPSNSAAATSVQCWPRSLDFWIPLPVKLPQQQVDQPSQNEDSTSTVVHDCPFSGDYFGTKIGSNLEAKMRLKGGLSAV